jgi:hypothetical protein
MCVRACVRACACVCVHINTYIFCGLGLGVGTLNSTSNAIFDPIGTNGPFYSIIFCSEFHAL